MGHIKKRFIAKKKVPKPYRSWFEHDLHQNALQALVHEGFTATYDIILRDRKYTPDFVSGDRLLEAKGCFRDRNEANKYLHIKASGYNVCFIFQCPTTPLPWAKKRKRCGTKMNHAEWAEKNGFEWCDAKFIPKEWRKP